MVDRTRALKAQLARTALQRELAVESWLIALLEALAPPKGTSGTRKLNPSLSPLKARRKDRMVMRQPSSKPGLLTLTIKDKSALYLAYMPFVKNGGLFIPTNSNYRLGDEVFMLLNLMGEDEKLPVAGRVIWMTPKGAQGKRTAGIGVQFSEQDRGNTQRKIESYLAGALGGDKPTHTM